MASTRGGILALLVVLACGACSPRESETLHRLREQVAHGHAQGAVHRASLEEASAMIIVDSGSLGASCLQYAAADVLQRAGYSVWTDNNPCLEGLRMTVLPDTDFSLTRARFTGYDSNWSQDVSVDIDLLGDRMTLQDVQGLAAKLIASPGFRKMAQTVSASESAGRFDIEPIRPADIRRSCGERWPSKPFTVE